MALLQIRALFAVEIKVWPGFQLRLRNEYIIQSLDEVGGLREVCSCVVL